MTELIVNPDYKTWLLDLKSKIKQSQIKASLTVNSQLIAMYWELGKDIVKKQQSSKWGAGLIEQLSKDLKLEFPEMGGFSKRNLELIKQWVLFYDDPIVITKQVVSQLQKVIFLIPWGHHILIIQKIKETSEAYFYIQQTIENNWSRSVLEMQIESKLFSRHGKAITNFKDTLPEIDSDLANALMKDPYNFDFLRFSTKIKERDFEQKLIENISSFLLELGKGFAYMGRQFLINVGGKEFRTDLLFYHTKLKCYIVIELKVTEFEPEFLGKLNFYLTAINELIKSDDDRPTIGILLCKNKNNVVVDFALKDINKPMGVSEYTYTQLPKDIQDAIPTLEQFRNELNREND
jgi:predicted nuclease of restriction endonuclease-like (RecB) superfamily